MWIFYALISVFFIAAGVFVFLFLKTYGKLKYVTNNLLNLNIRKGYYAEQVNLTTNGGKKSDSYNSILYVTETDRYTNGYSNLILDKIEVVSGYEPSNYSYIKKTLESRFSSLKPTADIEWLESVNTIKDLRKEKLKSIMKIKK